MEPWMNVYLGPSIALAEKVLGSCDHFVKGMDISRRLKHIQERILANGCVFAETDYSAFDSTVHLALRRIEYEAFRPFFLNVEAELAYIILITNSVIRHVELDPSHEYGNLVIPSMRYSGEPGTSIGNGLINCFVWWSYDGRPPGGFALAEGDDGFVASSRPFPLDALARRLGLEMKIDWHGDFTEVKFCGRYVAVVSDRRGSSYVTTFADIRRQLDKFHLCFSNSTVDTESLLRGKCLANLALDGGTPGVAWASYAHLMRLGNGDVAFSEADRYRLELSGSDGAIDLAVEPHVSFDAYEAAKAQGLSPGDLAAFDARMRDWGYGLLGEKPKLDFGKTGLKTDMDVTSVVGGLPS